MNKDGETRVFIAGHRGMVGSALLRRLDGRPGVDVVTRSRAELDLTRPDQVEAFLADHGIDQIYLAAARVGGIQANNEYPADFIHDNLAIQNSVIHAAHRAGVKQLLFLGSSCIYPRDAQQPMAEDALMTGPLEPTNEPYAIAKIAGIKMCESYRRQHGRDFRSIMPTNLYGPNDNFDPASSHVLAALLRKAHEASLQGSERMQVWGSGRPRREFLHVDDLASACTHLMELPEQRYWSAVRPQNSHINAGTGVDLSIRELALLALKVAGCEATLAFDPSKPDGTPRKLLDIRKITALGWSPAIGLEDGMRDTYQWMVAHWDALT
ncbi:MAG TPA: GDP-L-fucose synthase [Xanthomonadales bacterium]|nr:GDP-L-fucose synthase [Xanthomonadales bacterium]